MYLFLDTETTGLDPKKNGIVQLAALKVHKCGDILSEFSSNVRPADGLAVEGRALSVCRRKHSEILDAPDEREVMDRFQRWYGNSSLIFAGFVCAYDQSMLWEMMGRTGIYIKYEIPKDGPMDVFKLVKKVLRKPEDVEDHKLTTCAKYFGKLREGAHNALEDCYMTVDVWKCAVKKEQLIKNGKQ